MIFAEIERISAEKVVSVSDIYLAPSGKDFPHARMIRGINIGKRDFRMVLGTGIEPVLTLLPTGF